jgi:hypothetical protein
VQRDENKDVKHCNSEGQSHDNVNIELATPSVIVPTKAIVYGMIVVIAITPCTVAVITAT